VDISIELLIELLGDIVVYELPEKVLPDEYLALRPAGVSQMDEFVNERLYDVLVLCQINPDMVVGELAHSNSLAQISDSDETIN
jgi:hypothetical protein